MDEFWAAKAEDGELTKNQRRMLAARQKAEFRRRYSYAEAPATKAYFGEGKGVLRRSALVQAECEVEGEEEVVGLVGIEVDDVSLGGDYIRSVPVMSNLSVAKSLRRRGVAVKLVDAAEKIAGKEGWGFPSCYLLVDGKNAPALKLYRKLGYKPVGTDKDGETLVPRDGGVDSVPAEIVVMKKNLKGGGGGGGISFPKLFATLLLAGPALLSLTPAPAPALDMDAFAASSLTQKKPDMSAEEAMCRYGQSGAKRGAACDTANIKKAGSDGKPDRGVDKCIKNWEMKGGEWTSSWECEGKAK